MLVLDELWMRGLSENDALYSWRCNSGQPSLQLDPIVPYLGEMLVVSCVENFATSPPHCFHRPYR